MKYSLILMLTAAVTAHGYSVRKQLPFNRLSVAEEQHTYYNREPQGRGTYAFGYDVDEANGQNTQFRHEERHPNGTVTGSYGYVMPDGNVQIVNYVADANGYRATIETVYNEHPNPIQSDVDNMLSDEIAQNQELLNQQGPQQFLPQTPPHRIPESIIRQEKPLLSTRRFYPTNYRYYYVPNY